MQRPSSISRAVVVAAYLALATSAIAPILEAQAPDRASALEVRKRFVDDLDSLQAKMLQLANAFPENKYAWRPGAGVRSVGEAFMHVASEYYVFTPMAYGATRSPVIPPGPESFKKFEATSTKADVLKNLKDGFAYMRTSLMALPPESITGTQKLFGGERTIIETSTIMTADLHEHLGQLIAYARVNGIKPPWSK
jgi:hypothetical protein